MPRSKFLHEITVHRGLLVSAIPSLIILAFAATDIITLSLALFIDIVLAFAGLAVLSVRSSKVTTNRLGTALHIASIQIGIAGIALTIKLLG